jgi:hypothetical protein
MPLGASVPAATAASAATPAMDATFIERNQVVERYLAGKLPPKGMIDFERFCRDNPQLVDSLGLPDRVNAALRLLEASGRPEPWAEKPRRFYEKPAAFFTVALVALAAAVIGTLMSLRTTEAERQVAVLEKRVGERPLRAATSTRPIVMVPSRTGPSKNPVVTLFGTSGEMAEMKIDVSWSKYTNFRLLLDRIDQGRVAILANQLRDSNGQLRLSLNSSALGPGDYQLTMEGLDWRGSAEPQAWVTFAVAP